MERKVIIRNPVPKGVLAAGMATAAAAAAVLALPAGEGCAAYMDPSTTQQSAADEKPSTPPRPPISRPVPEREARKMERKVIIRKPIPKGALAAGKAPVVAVAVLALPAGYGCSPDKPSSHRNASLDGEQNASEIGLQKLPSGFNAIDVDETLLGSANKTFLGEEAVGGGTLIGKPVANTDSDACEAEELASASIGNEGFGMLERQWRRMTEVFVCGLDAYMKEEDVRLLFRWAGKITATEVWMAMDPRTSKSKGYCFLRYREPSQAKKVVEEFCKLKVVSTHCDEFKVCGKLCQVKVLDGNDTIVLENIDKEWKKEDIMKLLQKTGVENIDSVTLMADSNNPGYNYGYALVELKTEKDAWMAYIKLSKNGVSGRCLNITVAWAKPMSDPDEEIQQVKSLPPMLYGNMLPIPVSVLQTRLARGQWQVLVHWEGLPASEASWEDVKSFRQRYPAFALEDELFMREGRDVMVGMKYHRRQHV